MQELFQQFPLAPRWQKGNQRLHTLCPQEPALLPTPVQVWNKLLLREVGRDTDTGTFQSPAPRATSHSRTRTQTHCSSLG